MGVENEITEGAIRGVFGAFVEWNSRRSQKRRLRQMLRAGKFEWRSVKEMAAAIGKDETDTKALLVEIKARPAAGKPDLWGLIGRVGLN